MVRRLHSRCCRCCAMRQWLGRSCTSKACYRGSLRSLSEAQALAAEPVGEWAEELARERGGGLVAGVGQAGGGGWVWGGGGGGGGGAGCGGWEGGAGPGCEIAVCLPLLQPTTSSAKI